MFDDIKKRIFSSTEFSQLARCPFSAGEPVTVQGIAGSLRAFVASFLFEEFSGQIVVVASEKDAAEQLRDDCAQLLPNSNVRLYTIEPFHDAQTLDMSAPISQVETLRALSTNTSGIYITHATALAYGVPDKKRFLESVFELGIHTEIAFQRFLERLAERGFERRPLVESYGDFAVRGGIVDVFPFIGEHPVRLEFWGDTVESIREFDALSQRSIRELQAVSIVPDINKLSAETKKIPLTDLFSSDTIFFLDDPQLLEKEFQELESEGAATDFSFADVMQGIEKFPRCVNSALHTSSENIIDFHSLPQPPCNGSVKIFLNHAKELSSKGFDVVITSDTQEELDRIQELIEEEAVRGSGFEFRDEIPENEDSQSFSSEYQDSRHRAQTTNLKPAFPIRYSTESFHAGFIFPSAQIALFTEHEIFGRIKRRGVQKRKRFKGISQKELHSLHRGDYVVHVDHGIGKFLGLQKITVGGTEQEAAKLEYAEQGILFVNLNYIARIQKYSSADGHVPFLNKLGSGEWERLKARAKKKIKDIARDLIVLYARRKHEPGISFSPDSHWQKEMEASFMFEDTPDQAKATLDVKADMETGNPMDRLICGDVGFGKTEVAVRAAFKAVQDGKQTAVLVPTTILAQQHFATFSDRLHRYPVRIESLSRFKSAKEQKKILDDLKAGAVDVVIGTHRLLSKDVVFKDLGLLVVDEEQRFGVTAKEKLRKMKSAVDTLSLTATPIPRTLHFSLMGARDLSIINTPPRNRLPIYTEIAQYDKKLIREAVLREIHRGGQVFIVNDRISNIDMFAATLQEYIPEARFRIAHGQMHGHELEQVMVDFLDKKFDVLVATKIIESGLDIPNVNTMIVNRADRFGLAELYQLRGRVGRSNVQAYAYLLVPPISSLPKTTLQRLQAIEEFTELGSGFNLAMRDLEIRGAGNLLGAQQSGFIMEMGFEMYTKILEEAVSELKTQEFSELFASQPVTASQQKTETLIEADLDAYIPDFYVEDDSERLDFYRRLYKASTQSTVDELRLELQDRFGAAVEETENLFALASLRMLGAQTGFRKVELNKRTLRLHFPPESEKEFYENGAFQSVMTKAGEVKSPAIVLKQERKNLFLQTFLTKEGGAERLGEVQEILEALK
ncbi:MAG: transcription-repair coupling factor [Bacteroidota bacterium]|nr:transcription-repair coupling factor [Bacteroidota bacterium]